jgi:prepilin-type N-terminal cleavage/methylation domain-containing protein
MIRRAKQQDGVTMIELLVSMIIAGILSTMLFGTWFVLQQSFRRSTINADQRNAARQAVSVMEREIRDAEALSSAGIFIEAKEDRMRFTTTFNNPGNEDYINPPQLVRYFLQEDPADAADLPAAKKNWQLIRYKGNKSQVLVDHVVNYSLGKPVFTYTYYDEEGDWQRSSNVTGVKSLQRILTVEVHLLVDQNPGHSPEYLDILTTVQPRNMRQT